MPCSKCLKFKWYDSGIKLLLETYAPPTTRTHLVKIACRTITIQFMMHAVNAVEQNENGERLGLNLIVNFN